MTGARFTYVILAHTDPSGVARLVRRIRTLSPTARVLVRHDHPELFDEAGLGAEGAEVFTSSVRVHWGDYSQVLMMLEALRVARELTPGDYYVLVSGQDYPIRPLARWETQVANEGHDALLEHMNPQAADLDLTWRVIAEPVRGGRSHVRRAVRHIGALAGRRLGKRLAIYPVTRGDLTRWWIGVPRRGVAPIAALKASSLLTLSDAAVAEVLRRDTEEPALSAYFRTVRTPDEYYVPSLLAGTGLRLCDTPTSAKTFLPGAASPVWVGVAELDAFAEGPAAFARKIPADVAPEVIARADALSSR